MINAAAPATAARARPAEQVFVEFSSTRFTITPIDSVGRLMRLPRSKPLSERESSALANLWITPALAPNSGGTLHRTDAACADPPSASAGGSGAHSSGSGGKSFARCRGSWVLGPGALRAGVPAVSGADAEGVSDPGADREWKSDLLIDYVHLPARSLVPPSDKRLASQLFSYDCLVSDSTTSQGDVVVTRSSKSPVPKWPIFLTSRMNPGTKSMSSGFTLR